MYLPLGNMKKIHFFWCFLVTNRHDSLVQSKLPFFDKVWSLELTQNGNKFCWKLSYRNLATLSWEFIHGDSKGHTSWLVGWWIFYWAQCQTLRWVKTKRLRIRWMNERSKLNLQTGFTAWILCKAENWNHVQSHSPIISLLHCQCLASNYMLHQHLKKEFLLRWFSLFCLFMTLWIL